MNKQIFQSFKSLSEIGCAELKHKYKDSPIGLRLIDFLMQTVKPDFKTREAVEYIYKGNKEEEYKVLENRYFKLRKKILDDLQQKPGEVVYNDLPEEEARLNHCKQMIAIGDKKEAYKQLANLEKQCWERNIFELLPTVLDNMIFCNQVNSEVDKNKVLYKKLEKAIELQYDLNRAIMLVRKVYEAFYAEGPGADKEILLAIKELGDKHKGYPRFLMFYHYVSVSYKLSSMDYASNMQVISRHLSDFRKLYDKNPMVPVIIYKSGYDKLFHFNYNQITAFYHTNRTEFEEAHTSLKEMWNMVGSGSPLFKSYRSDPLHFNMFTIQCVTGRYREALETLDAFSSFVRDTGPIEKMALINMLKGVLYLTAYPQTFRLDRNYLREQVDEYIKLLKRKGDNVMLPLAQAVVFKMEFFLLLNNYKEAAKLITDEKVRLYLKSINSYGLFDELFTAIKSEDKKKLNSLEERISQQKYKAVKIDEFLTLNWLIKYIKSIGLNF
jgi:hypothetical protein